MTRSILRADSGISSIIWLVFLWLVLAAQWQARKHRRDARRAGVVIPQERKDESAQPSDRAATAPSGAGSIRQAVLEARKALGDALTASVRESGPFVPRREEERGETAGSAREGRTPDVVAVQPARSRDVVAADWNNAIQLERAGKLAEAKEIYAAIASVPGERAESARIRLERIGTIEGAGWAPWGADPFGRVPALDITAALPSMGMLDISSLQAGRS